MKRILTMLLVFCAVFGLMMPLTAFAAEPTSPLGCSESGTNTDLFHEQDGENCEIATSGHGPSPTGSVTVIKVDATDMAQRGLAAESSDISPLAGTVFGLYTRTGQKIAELTIGNDGTATYAKLSKGDYYIKELVPAEGFILSDETFPFSIGTKKSHVEIIVPNERSFGIVKVLKTGENGAPLAGVAFDIYRSANDEKVGELRTGADGSAQAELPLGRYYLVETATAEGYLLPEGSVAFALVEHGATVEVEVQNKKEPAPQPQGGRIRLIKQSEDGKLLPGAVFGVYRADTNEKVDELATGSDGAAVSAALPVLERGYYLLEQTAPAGYVLSNEKAAVTVKEGETTEITLTNQAVEKPTPPAPESKPGKLLIIKKAEKTGTLLKGAVFGVYRTSDGKHMGEITTDRYGEATLELESVEYYLRELEAPAGFKLESDRVAFRIKSEEIREVTVINKQEASTAGSLLIIKKSEDGKPLSGAVFGVYDAATREKLEEISIDRYGEAVLELEAGGYFLRELKAPTGYELSTDKVDFKIRTGETKAITLINKLLKPETPEASTTGTVKLIKKAAGSGQPLPGAVFEVFSLADNIKIGEIMSGVDGTAALSLPAGDYYLLEKTAPAGYKLESSRILFRIKVGAVVKVEVTNMKEDGSQPVQPSKPNPPTGTPGISIPKTGEAFPTLDYTLAGLLFALAGACGIALWRGRRKGQHRA